jgi:apolipoprotein D and lipocalin family protein
MKKQLFIISMLISTMGMAQKQTLETVAYVDINKYMGKWYEIASFPQRFQKGCSCSEANYSLNKNGTVKVVNKCIKNGKLSEATAKAKVKDKKTNAKLSVQFFWPFTGKYWIIDLADDYSYAVIGHPNRKYLWILSRDKNMPDATYEKIVARCKEKGFDVSQLKKTFQLCEATK